MQGHDGLSSVVSAIYQAILSPDEIPAIFRTMGELFDAPVVALAVYDGDGKYVTATGTGIDAAVLDEYQSYYRGLDCVIERLMLMPPGAVYRRRDLISDEDLMRTEFYNDFMVRFPTETIQAVLPGDDGRRVAVSVLRHAWQQPFDQDDMQRLGLVLDHMRRAQAIGMHIRGLEARQRSLQRVLDMMTVGVVLLDGAGRVILANRLAGTMLAAGPVQLKGERIVTRLAGRAGRLEQMLRGAAGSDRRAGALRLADGGDQLTLFAVPMTQGGSAAADAAAAVFLLDHGFMPRRVETCLEELYGLTPMEIRTTARLLAGLGIDAIAAEFGVSRETVRFHLKGIFAKTETGSQVQLQRVVGRAVASLDFSAFASPS